MNIYEFGLKLGAHLKNTFISSFSTSKKVLILKKRTLYCYFYYFNYFNFLDFEGDIDFFKSKNI